MTGRFRTGKNPGRQVITIVLMIVFSSLANVILSQDIKSKPTRQSSLEAFSKGDYEKAYSEFRELLMTYPKDPLYKYYSGVCLVKMNINAAEAEKLLKDALNGATALRSLPSDAFFYLGRSQQMQGKFDEAVSTYNQFTREAGRKKAKEEDVPALIQQCKNREGKLSVAETTADTDQKKDVKTLVEQEKGVLPASPEPGDKKNEINPARPAPVVKELAGNYEKILDDAVVLQSEADSLNDLAARQRKEAATMTGSEKSRLLAVAAANESQAQDLQKSADRKYSQAQSSMNAGHDTGSVKKITSVTSTVPELTKDTVSQSANTVKKAPVSKQVTNTEKQIE